MVMADEDEDHSVVVVPSTTIVTVDGSFEFLANEDKYSVLFKTKV